MNRRFPALIPAVALMSLLSLAGCSMAPDYIRPEMELPANWVRVPAAWTASADAGLDVLWWRRFEDDKLNALVEEALANNRDIAQAMARVDFARARLGLARSDQFPAPGLGGSAARARSSRLGLPPATPGHETNSLMEGNLGISSWEIDLWGKYASMTGEAKAQLLASEATRDGVWLTVAGETAKAYFLLRSHDLQESIAAGTLKTRQEAFKIYSARYNQGLIDELDLLRVKTEVETARNALYGARLARDAAESGLAALVGRSPQAIMEEGVIDRGRELEKMPVAPVLPAGLPSDLLERRPDIRAAEQSLIATNFNIGTARAVFFPSFSLTGLLGFSSTEPNTFFSGHARTWQFGGGLYLPLDFWRLQANLYGAEAQQREAVAAYEKTVQNAFSDMRNALSQQSQYADMVRSLEIMVRDLDKAVDLAKTRYDNGYSAYLEVLDAERSLFNAQLDLATARSNTLAGIVNVCIALGGGWKE
jgi:multidrug efflux system outer membrane protein